jgi:hypothetical protein
MLESLQRPWHAQANQVAANTIDWRGRCFASHAAAPFAARRLPTARERQGTQCDNLAGMRSLVHRLVGCLERLRAGADDQPVGMMYRHVANDAAWLETAPRTIPSSPITGEPFGLPVVHPYEGRL